MYDDSRRAKEFLLRLTGNEDLSDFNCAECMKIAEDQLLAEGKARGLDVSQVHKDWLTEFFAQGIPPTSATNSTVS